MYKIDLKLQGANHPPPPQQVELVDSCMNAIGKAPNWKSQTLGILLTKCLFDTGTAKSQQDASWDALEG